MLTLEEFERRAYVENDPALEVIQKYEDDFADLLNKAEQHVSCLEAEVIGLKEDLVCVQDLLRTVADYLDNDSLKVSRHTLAEALRQCALGELCRHVDAAVDASFYATEDA